MLLACVATLIPILTVWILLRRFINRSFSTLENYLLLFLAAPLGFSLSAALFIFSYITLVRIPYSFALIETATILLCLIALRIIRAHPIPIQPTDTKNSVLSSPKWLTILLSLGLTIAVALDAFFTITHYRLLPLGDWDAVAMWNAKSKFLYRGGENWKLVFSSQIAHSEYPLLLPAAIARLWMFVGSESTLVPLAIAGLSALCLTGSLVFTIAVSRGLAMGLLAGIVLLSSQAFRIATASQNADIPLGWLMLTSVCAMVYYEQTGKNISLLLLSGLLAGFAAAVKNEGTLFLVCFLLVWGITLAFQESRMEGFKRLSLLCIATLPGVLIQFYSKIMSESANDLITGQSSASTLERLTDWDRYRLIGIAIWNEAWNWRRLILGLLCFCLLNGFAIRSQRSTALKQCWAILALMATGYLLVYLTTPHDLNWHLRTSFDRLVVQLWPVFLLCLFLSLKPLSSFEKTPP